MVTEWERGFDKLANSLMGTENFSKSMNQMQDMQMGARNAFREFMTGNLTNANMPTRDDVVRVAEAIQGLEKRMQRIEDMLTSMTSNSQKPPTLARTDRETLRELCRLVSTCGVELILLKTCGSGEDGIMQQSAS